ncbi:MAG: inositol monophosphatase family protein [Bacteroidota bacterium]
MSPDLRHLLGEVEKLSVSVGRFIVTQRKGAFRIDEKSFNNLVTEVDKAAEEKFVEGLMQILPGAGFIAEEGTGSRAAEGYNWIIDPIDGTTNFVHNVPLYCTSVGLFDGNDIVLGVINEPNGKECFSAAKGLGAFLNGHKMHVSASPLLLNSLIATGFPYDDFARENGYFKVLKDFTHKTRGIRRLGSAALDLAYVACGRFDSFYEYGLNPWDVAAGIILVEEAGGRCSDFRSGRNMLFGEEIIASNQKIHQEMEVIIQQVFSNND